MNFDFLEENYEEPFFDKSIKFPQIDFNKTTRFDQFYSRSQLVLQRIKIFKLPPALLTIIYNDQRNSEYSEHTIIQYSELIIYYRDKESKINDQQKLLTIAFIIMYVSELKLYDKFSYDIDILFNPLVFPKDPINSDSFNFTQNIDLFLLDYIYQTDGSKALDLYSKIFNYWSLNESQTILNFMPLFIQLLYQWKSSNFFSIFKQSTLFFKILNAAQDSYILFNFVWNCVQIYPEEFFQSKNGLSMISFYFFKADLRAEAATFLEKALKVANQDQQIQKQIFQVISTIISSFIDKEDPEAIIILFDLVTNCFPDLKLSLIQDAFQTSIFDLMAKIAISSSQYFTKFLFFLTKMGTDYYDFIEFYAKRKSIHNILNQFQCDKIPLFELFKFAFCSNVTKDYSHQYIRNCTAINLLFNIFINNEKDCLSQEETIVQSLLKLSQNKGNLIELNRAKVPEFILKRLPSIQNNSNILDEYLTLFSTITISIYDNTTFYRTIELLKNPNFKYPIKILDKLSQNLIMIMNSQRNSNANNNNRIPRKFFRFENPKGCGIFGPNVKLPGTFSVFFWIRLNDIVNNVSFPLLFFDFGKSQICFEFEKTHLYVSESRKQERPKFNFEFEQGKWYYIVITLQRSFSYQNISLFVNNNKESEVKINSKLWSTLTSECSISVCSKSSDPKSSSLLCDLSSFYIINSADSSLDLTKIVNSSPELIVCNYDPSNAHEGLCFNVTSNKSVPFKGRTIPIMSSLENVVKTVGAIKNFLPLFDRVSANPLHSDIKIDPELGTTYLSYLIKIVSQMISISEENFTKNSFIEIFASFLNDCDSSFMNISVISELSILLFSLKCDELRSQMMKYVFLNYEIASKLDEKSSSNLFATILKIFIFEGHQYIYEFDFNLLIYKTIQYFNEETEISNNAWIFLKHVLLSDPFALNEIITSLLMSMSNLKSNYVTEKILEILFILISEDTADYFQKFSYYSPFLIPLSESSTVAQITSLNCILKLNKFADFNIKNSINEIIEILQKNDNYFDLFVDHVLSIFLNDEETSKINLNLLPLLVHSTKLSSDIQKQSIVASIREILIENHDITISLLKFPLWYSYLMSLFESFYDANNNTEIFSSLFSNLFTFQMKNCEKEDFSSNDFSDFFNFLTLRSFLNSISYKKLKSHILTELLQKNTNENQILSIFPVTFEYIAFDISIVSFEENCKLSFQLNSAKTMETDEILKPAELLIKLACKLNKTIKILDVIEVNIILATAYLSFTLFKADSEINSYFIEEATKNFINFDKETRESCNLIITHSICPTEGFDLINNSWVNSVFYRSDEILKTKEAKIDKINNDLNNGKFEFIGLDENYSLSKRFLSISNPDFFSFYCAENESYFDFTRVNFEIEQKMLIRLKKSFLLDISEVPGPWHKMNDNLKFKVLNRISRNGQRILMVINKRFDDHKIASLNRDRKYQEEVSKENYYYKQIKQRPFIHETRIFTSDVTMRSLWRQIQGTLNVSSRMIHFYSENKIFSIDWNNVEFILNRRVANIDNSCEIFTISGRSYFIIFSKGERKRLYSYISKLNLIIHESRHENQFDFFSSLRHICQSIYQTKSSSEIISKLPITNLWKSRKITTYSYIYYLNLLSGRSFNDTKQYPIFPIIIKNCDSDSFNLNDENSYRDLTKPTAFICPKQREVSHSQNLYNQLPSNEFLVSWSMVRVEPFATFQICLQGNKFLEASRQFYSIKGYWNMMYTSVVTNENTPEYFTFPYLYVNENRFDLGVKQNDQLRIDDVILPNWAENAHVYTNANRIALEGDVASNFVHKWIDLYFGVYRRFFEGKKLYPYYAYSELLDNSTNKKLQLFQNDDNEEEDFEIKFSEEDRINNCEEFGTMPTQLFYEEHVSRNDINNENLNYIKKPPKIDHFKTPSNITHILKDIIICQDKSKAFIIGASKDALIGEVSLPAGIGDLLCYSRKNKLAIFGTKMDPFLTVFNLNNFSVETSFHHNSIITAATVAAGRYLVTGGSDCALYVWDLESDKKVPMSTSGFHSNYVTSIGCCYENGLLVSVDNSSTIVFETLFDHIFIASVSAEKLKGKKRKLGLKKKSSFNFRTDPNQRVKKSYTNENENTNNENKQNENENTNNENKSNENENTNNENKQDENKNTNNENKQDEKENTNNENKQNENESTNNEYKQNGNENTNNENKQNENENTNNENKQNEKEKSVKSNENENISNENKQNKNKSNENSNDVNEDEDDSEYDDNDDDVNESIFIPQIIVFRSGVVCISQKRKVICFDSRGKEISRLKLTGDFIEMRKYYDYDTREFLIIGSSPKYIEIIDITTFTVFAKINIFKFHFYPIKNTRSILVSSIDELHIFNFGDCIPLVIKKYSSNDSPPAIILKEQKNKH